MRVTISITADADRMLDALAREQMRSRGAVIEVLLRAAQSDTTVALNAAQSATPVCAEYAQSDTVVAQKSHSDFHAAMLAMDAMCS